MSKKGLGKGLDALFGDANDASSNDFEYLPLQKIEPNPDQPRTVFDEEGLNSLADSIRSDGVITPIIVRRIDGGFYQIISGERRWRASREAGLEELPARIFDGDDKTARIIAMIDNLQRDDFNPIDEARGYKNIMEKDDMTQEEVAQRVGKSRPAVANALRLLSLPAELIQMVKDKELSTGSARALLALKSDELMKSAAKSIIGSDMSVREVESLVKKLNREKPGKSKKAGFEVNYVLEAQNRLTAAMGRRVTIKQGKGKGKIELEYYDLEDFDVLFATLLAGEGKKH